MSNLDSLNLRIASNNNAIDKATALGKVADLLTVCSKSIESAGRMVKLYKDIPSEPAHSEDTEINEMFGNIN